MPMPQLRQPGREYVTFSELAQDILGLSRARLYELVARGAMPQPCYCIRTRRPIFTREQQDQAATVLRTGVGVDGSIVIRYRRNRQIHVPTSPPPTRGRRRTPTEAQSRFTDLVGSLQSLGVTQADERSVAAAVAECFPAGIESQQESDVLRAVFRHLRRSQSA